MADENTVAGEGQEDDILKCSICLEIFDKPKYLPCLHTFCEHCLNSYITSTVKEDCVVGETEVHDHDQTKEVGECGGANGEVAREGNTGTKLTDGTGVKSNVDSESKEKTKAEFKCPFCRGVVPVPDSTLPPEEWSARFPNNHLITSLLDKQKLQNNAKKCDLCHLDNNEVDATSWCGICSEALCEICANYHRKMVATRQHKLFVISEQNKHSFDITKSQYCETHTAKQLEAFCIDHDQACCVTCITIKHRKCDNVTTLEDAAKDGKPEVKRFCKELKEMEETLAAMQRNVEGNISGIQEQKQDMLNQIANYRGEMDKHLDEVQSKLEKEIEDMERQLVSKKKDTVSDIENQQKCIANYRKVFTVCVEQTSDPYVFLEMKRLQRKIEEIKQFLKLSLNSIQNSDCQLKMSDEITKYVLSIGSLGSTNILKTPIHFTVFSGLEELDFVKMLREESGFEEILSFNISDADVKGAVFLPDGKIATTSKNDIYFYDSSGKKTSCMKISEASQLDGILVINENDMLVARSSGYQQFKVNFQQNEFKKIFNKCCYDFTSSEGKIIAAQENNILHLNLNGDVLKTISVEPDVRNITSRGEKLYYTNSKNHTLYCTTFEGNVQYKYTHPELKKPCGVTTDKDGHVFVAGYDSSNVHLISPDGQHRRIILGEKDGIKRPYAIFFDTVNKKLLVSHTDCKISVYKRVW